MTPRLSSNLFVNMLVRLAEQQGGNGMVLAKGDATAGAITVLLAERGRPVELLERMLQADGHYRWSSPVGGGKNAEELAGFLEKRRRSDPDCWILELDTASAERFADEIRSLD